LDSGFFGFWLRFGSVTGFFKPAPSSKPRQTPKILAAHRYIFSVNTLKQLKIKNAKLRMSRAGRVLKSAAAGGLSVKRGPSVSI
jgi:hypothetical protein